jgi:hypothetical protein
MYSASDTLCEQPNVFTHMACVPGTWLEGGAESLPLAWLLLLVLLQGRTHALAAARAFGAS